MKKNKPHVTINILNKIAMSKTNGEPIDDSLLISYANILVGEIPGMFRNPRIIAIAGESVIVRSFMEENNMDVAIKICLPVRVVSKWDNVKKVVGLTPQVKYEEIEEILKRFIRSVLLQLQMHQILAEEQLFGVAHIPRVLKRYPNKKNPNVRLNCYIMEYVEGLDLFEYAIKETTTRENVLDLFEKIFRVFMICFHGRGIIHTDIKPMNFKVLQASHMPVILDFGIAKNINDNQDVEDITSIHTQQLATQKWSTLRQRKFPKTRRYYEDIFALGLLFHAAFTKENPILKVNRDLIDTWELFPPEILPIEFREFFIKCTDEDDVENQFKDISQMYEFYQKCCTLYVKNNSTTVYEGDIINNISSFPKIETLEVCKFVKKKFRKAVYYLLEGLNEI